MYTNWMEFREEQRIIIMKMEGLPYKERLKETQHSAVTNNKKLQKINAPNLIHKYKPTYI